MVGIITLHQIDCKTALNVIVLFTPDKGNHRNACYGIIAISTANPNSALIGDFLWLWRKRAPIGGDSVLRL